MEFWPKVVGLGEPTENYCDLDLENMHTFIPQTSEGMSMNVCFFISCTVSVTFSVCLFVALWLCSLTLLSVVSIGITGHASRQPPSQTGTLRFSALVFHILSIPDDIVLPLQLGHH